MKKYSKIIGALGLFVLLCLCAAAVTHNSETLTDYAQREPEIAYAEHPSEEEDMESVENADSLITETAALETQLSENPAEPIYYQEKEMNAMVENPERVTYQPDFYHEPLSEDIKQRIYGLSYKEDCTVPYEDLRYVRVLYVNFKENVSTGELICNKAIAQDLVEIFYELYQANYQIEQIRLVDEYGADDLLSMKDNNTSCFNYRPVEGTARLSKHALGLAIDINPFFNPYVEYKNGALRVSPEESAAYADRSQPFAYKIDENDLCYKLFKEHGFTWGGHWNSCKDYQHFQKNIE